VQKTEVVRHAREMAALTWLRAYLKGIRMAKGMVQPRLRDCIGFV